jgi:hypothetical protein
MRYRAPPDKTVVTAVRDITTAMNRVSQALPHIELEDLVNVIAYNEGRLGQSASMLEKLNRRRSPPVDLVRHRKR